MGWRLFVVLFAYIVFRLTDLWVFGFVCDLNVCFINNSVVWFLGFCCVMYFVIN